MFSGLGVRGFVSGSQVEPRVIRRFRKEGNLVQMSCHKQKPDHLLSFGMSGTHYLLIVKRQTNKQMLN